MALSGALGETASSARLVFANPNLRRVNLALAGSMVGDWAFATAVIVWAYQYGGAAAVGGYAVVRLLLIALTLPFVSTLVDKIPYRLFLVTTDLVRAVLVLAAAGIIWLDGPPIAVLVLSVAAGLVGAPFRPAQMALLPSLAKTPHELTAANAVSSTLESLSFFLGPAIAGLLLSATNASAVFVLNALTFVWSAVLLSGLPAGDRKPGRRWSRRGLPPAGRRDRRFPDHRAGPPSAAGHRLVLRADRHRRSVDRLRRADRGRRGPDRP